MKKFLLLFLAFSIFLSNFAALADNSFKQAPVSSLIDEYGWALEIAAPANASIDISADSAILIEEKTGDVLFEKDADKKVPIASVTKVMTLLLVMEALDDGVISLDDMVTVSDYAASMGGSQAWMEPGEKLSVNEMLKAVAVSSCNDGAVALGEHLAGSESEFVRRMNERAVELGMTNTSFLNCTGLDDNQVHYSTARDVAIMSRELIGHEKIFDYTTIWTDTIRNGAFGLSNTNKLIRFYNGATGLKTGSTSKAKFCLSATAKRDNTSFIAVVLGSPSSAERFQDAKRLLDYGFANFALYNPQPLEKNSIAVTGGKSESVDITGDFSPFVVKKGQENKIEVKVDLSETLTAPVDKSQKVGQISFLVDGNVLKSYNILTKDEVEKADFLHILRKLVKKILE